MVIENQSLLFCYSCHGLQQASKQSGLVVGFLHFQGTDRNDSLASFERTQGKGVEGRRPVPSIKRILRHCA